MAPTNGMLRSLLFIYRSVGPFKFISTHLYGWRFCSSVSDNWNQAQWGIRGKEEGEFPEGKLLDLVVSSLRVDRVLASGLGMGRRFVFMSCFNSPFERERESHRICFGEGSAHQLTVRDWQHCNTNAMFFVTSPLLSICQAEPNLTNLNIKRNVT